VASQLAASQVVLSSVEFVKFDYIGMKIVTLQNLGHKPLDSLFCCRILMIYLQKWCSATDDNFVSCFSEVAWPQRTS
jgi:hypothetical protein